MADLDMGLAETLAEALTTIGHPRSKAAIQATATDLWSICKGAILDGRPWTADEQAGWLVKKARTTWENGWPERGGTAALYSLFRAKFSPRAEHRPIDAGISPEQHAAWRAQYGAPDTTFQEKVRRVLGVGDKQQHAMDRKGSLWQAIRDSVYYTEGPGRHEIIKDRHSSEFWADALTRHERKRRGEVAAFRAELEQHGWEALMAFDWTTQALKPVRDGKMLASEGAGGDD